MNNLLIKKEFIKVFLQQKSEYTKKNFFYSILL
jgi:hypothetical protein